MENKYQKGIRKIPTNYRKINQIEKDKKHKSISLSFENPRFSHRMSIWSTSFILWQYCKISCGILRFSLFLWRISQEFWMSSQNMNLLNSHVEGIVIIFYYFTIFFSYMHISTHLYLHYIFKINITDQISLLIFKQNIKIQNQINIFLKKNYYTLFLLRK